MTATPIPRTLALTLYGDLDTSVLDELPPGRTPITTRSIADERADEVWDFVRKQVDAGRQAYIVYPVIEGAPAEQQEMEFAAELGKAAIKTTEGRLHCMTSCARRFFQICASACSTGGWVPTRKTRPCAASRAARSMCWFRPR